MTGTVRRLLSTARCEILSTAAIGDVVLEHVPPGRTLTVTAARWPEPNAGAGSGWNGWENLLPDPGRHTG